MVESGTPDSKSSTTGQQSPGLNVPTLPPPPSASVTTPAPKMSGSTTAVLKLLGGKRRDDKRTEDEFLQTTVAVKKEDRAGLDKEKRAKFHSYATEGMKPRFGLLKIEEGTEELENVYHLALRVSKFRESLEAYQLDDVFYILPMDKDLKDVDNQGMPVCLFDSFKQVTLEEIKASSRFYYENGEGAWIPENLRWSGEKLLKSCDYNLRELLEDKLLGSPAIDKNGPVYFKLMMDTVFNDSDKAMRGLLVRVQEMKLTDYAGEDVRKAGSFLRGTVMILENCSFTPPDLGQLIIKFFKTGTCDEFTQHINALDSMMTLKLLTPTPKEIIDYAEADYLDRVRNGKWDKYGEGNTKSAFTSQLTREKDGEHVDGGGGKYRGPGGPKANGGFKGECYNCGKKGHMARDCKALPKNQPNGKQRGKERDGGKEKNNPLTQPPGKGENHWYKTKGGTVMFWCSKCREWNADHKLDGCPHTKALPHANLAEKEDEDPPEQEQPKGKKTRIATLARLTGV